MALVFSQKEPTQMKNISKWKKICFNWKIMQRCFFQIWKYTYTITSCSCMKIVKINEKNKIKRAKILFRFKLYNDLGLIKFKGYEHLLSFRLSCLLRNLFVSFLFCLLLLRTIFNNFVRFLTIFNNCCKKGQWTVFWDPLL